MYYIYIYRMDDGSFVDRKGPYETRSDTLQEEIIINLNPVFEDCFTMIEEEE